MLITAAALLAALLGGAAALPQHQRRPEDDAVAVHVAVGLATVAAELAELAERLPAAVSIDAQGQRHLYFHATDTVGNLARCGEVDAAPQVPAELFEPENALALAAYVEVTLELYNNPNPLASPLGLGRCESIGFTRGGAFVQGITWFGRFDRENPLGLMGAVCSERCSCSFRGDGPAGLPLCRDVPDVPAAGEFCSLCGPSTACRDCSNNTVIVEIFFRGEADEKAARQALAQDGGAAVGLSGAVRSSGAELATLPATVSK